MALTGSNQSVEKTFRIIEHMAASSSMVRLGELAKAVELPASTTLRMLNTLIDMGYAYQDAQTKCYGLSLRFRLIGQQISDHFPLHDIIHPYLLSLSQDTQETCCVANQYGYKIQYFDVANSKSHCAITIRQQIGVTAYMHCTGSGKIFLTSTSMKDLDDLIATEGLPAFTPHTITTRDALLAEVERCKKQGYAYDDEEVELGMRCIAAPIYDSLGRMAVAMSISGPIARMSDERIETELLPRLLDTANAITQQITGLRNS